MAARKPFSTTAASRLVPSCATWLLRLCCLLAAGCLNPLPEEVPSDHLPAGPDIVVTPAGPAPGPELGLPTSGSEDPVDVGSGPPRDCSPDAGAVSCEGAELPACSPCDAGRDAQP
jgi:hypothetical protein